MHKYKILLTQITESAPIIIIIIIILLSEHAAGKMAQWQVILSATARLKTPFASILLSHALKGNIHYNIE